MLAATVAPTYTGIEEAVAGGVGDDREGQHAVVGMEILGARRFLRRVIEAVAAHRLADRARLGKRTARKHHRRRGDCCRPYGPVHDFSSHDMCLR